MDSRPDVLPLYDLADLLHVNCINVESVSYLVSRPSRIRNPLARALKLDPSAIGALDVARQMLPLADLSTDHLLALLGYRTDTPNLTSPGDNIFRGLVYWSQHQELLLGLAQSPSCNEWAAALILQPQSSPTAVAEPLQRALAARGLFTPTASALISQNMSGLHWTADARKLLSFTTTVLNPSKVPDPTLATTAWILAQNWSGQGTHLMDTARGILTTA